MNSEIPSVLFIDDDPTILDMLKLIFERSREMTVQTAQSAKEALGILTEKTFDVIIVDYDMPEINGIEFLKILRKQGNTTPIILFTGLGGEHTAIEALNNGANYLMKKGEDPRHQFNNLAALVRKAAEQSVVPRTPGTIPRMMSDMVNFTSDPCFAINEGGTVVAWNDAMELFTGVPATSMIGKGDGACSEPFFGSRKKMLVNLVFEPDDEIKRRKYVLISRVRNGPVTAVTRGLRKEGRDRALWMKAMPVFDDQGNFIASIGVVRDVTATFGDSIVQDAADEPAYQAPSDTKKPAPGLINRILKKSPAVPPQYKQGVLLLVKEKKYREALDAFDQVLATDNNLPYVWNDRGTCLRELGDLTNAYKSISRAVKMDPENPEFLFNLGEILETIGLTNMNNKYLESAVQSFKMVVDMKPNNASAWNHMGVCFNKMGKTDEAKFYFDRARDIKIWKKDTPLERKRDEFL